MKRKSINVIVSLLFILIGAVIGFLVGTSIGGNYYPNFKFLSYQGYEATGWIGIVLGALLGLILSLIIRSKVGKRKS